MALFLANWLQTDDLTILLALIAATLFLLNNLYKPQPLVHPILLGRQSDVGRARNPAESAVYRNYSTGLMGRFPLRPSKEIHIIADFVRPEVEAARTLWSTKLTNSHLQDRAAAFGTGLIRLGRLQPSSGNVLLLLNDCLEFVVADLALASHSITSFTLSSSHLLSPVLETHTPSAFITHAFMLPHLLEFIYDSGHRTTEHIIVVVGEPSAQTMASVASNIKVLNFADVEREGIKSQKILSPIPRPSDVFTVSFYESPSGQLQGAQLTHENITAGVAAIHSLVPLSHSFSPLDTILSAHSMSTPYGRAVAYTAIYEGTSFATIATSEVFREDENDIKEDSSVFIATKKYPTPSPTVLFVRPGHLRSMVTGVLEVAKEAKILYPVAWRHKLANVSEGFITNQSLWDRVVFDGARSTVLGHCATTLRAVIVGDGHLEASLLTPSRIALSVPVVNAFIHPLVAAPVLASHPLDLQDFPVGGSKALAHCGPPSINVEVKLVGVNDDAVESGADPVGKLFVRGPPVGKLMQPEGYVDVTGHSDTEGEDSDWISVDVQAKVQANGSFQLTM